MIDEVDLCDRIIQWAENQEGDTQTILYNDIDGKSLIENFRFEHFTQDEFQTFLSKHPTVLKREDLTRLSLRFLSNDGRVPQNPARPKRTKEFFVTVDGNSAQGVFMIHNANEKWSGYSTQRSPQIKIGNRTYSLVVNFEPGKMHINLTNSSYYSSRFKCTLRMKKETCGSNRVFKSDDITKLFDSRGHLKIHFQIEEVR